MSLNGLDPFLVFTFSDWATGANGSSFLSGTPILGSLIKNIGVPIPIYLSEKLTGIYVQKESNAIDVDTQIETRQDDKSPVVWQRGVNSIVTVDLIAKRSSVILAALLALSEVIFQKLTSQNYKLSYFNGPVAIFGGLLHGFQVSPNENTDLLNITIQIQKIGTPLGVAAPLSLQNMITGAGTGSGLGVGTSFPMTITKSVGPTP